MMLNLLQLATVTNSASVPVTLAVSAMLGLFLYVMGRKLVKVAVGLCGLCIGAVLAFIGANHLGVSSQVMLVWVIGGAVAGVLLASLLFRFWMSVSLAGLVALAVPAFSVIWQGTTATPSTDLGSVTPPSKLVDDATKDDLKKKSDIPVNQFSVDDVKKAADKVKESVGIDDDDIERVRETIMDVFQEAYDFQRSHITGWWESLPTDGQRNMTITTAIAGLVGALLGFMLPYFSASVQTALVGGAILLSTVHGVVNAYAPAQAVWLPNEPRPLLITLSLITLVGVCIQWTLWRKAADK